MHRRDLLAQLALVAAGPFVGRIIQASAAGVNLHSAPDKSVLNASQTAMVAQLAELIIPETDTPGARAAGVPEFISRIVSDWYTPTERRIFCDGLASLDSDCIAQHKKPFSECSPAQQTRVLQDADEQSRSYHRKGAKAFDGNDEQAPFFFKLKELTVFGFYTSEVGATKELSYNPVPGHYDGDYDFSKVGRQWSF